MSNATPAQKLTDALASVREEDRATVLYMLELFNGLTSTARREWLAGAQAAHYRGPGESQAGKDTGELFERGLRIVRGESDPQA